MPVSIIVVLTGPPGAGKTTLAAAVVDRFDPSVNLPADEFWRWIRKGWVPPWEPGSRHQNTVAIEAATGVACRYAGGGYSVVVDGVIGPWFIDVFVAAAAANGLELHYVILRPTLEVALGRAAGRGGDELTDPGPVEKMHRAFCDLGRYESHVVDTTSLDVAESVAAVLCGLESGRFLLAGEITADLGS